MPAINSSKLNQIIRYLEKSGTILIDGDGYVVWTRGEKYEMSSLSDTAELSPEFREFLKKSKS